MTLISAADLAFQHPAQVERLIRDARFEIHPGDRIAVVGPNGAGKTTLLRLLAGELAPAAGAIVRRRGLRVAYVRQERAAPPDQTLASFALSARPELSALQAAFTALEPRLDDDACALRYAEAIAEFGEAGGYAAEAEAARVLEGLGFESASHALPMGCLSSGQRTRAELARLLLAPADMLLIDEPTNHLDADACAWLEDYMARLEAAYVLVSHDRAFLARTAHRTFELKGGLLSVYEGDYGWYKQQRAQREARAWEAYHAQERRLAVARRQYEERQRLARKVAETPKGPGIGAKDFYAAKAARIERTARILRERPLAEPQVAKPVLDDPMPVLSFPNVRRSGEIALAADGLAKGYGERPLFSGLSLQLARGERLAVTGPNGVGKTTLLRVLAGLSMPDAGRVERGLHVQLGYYAQEAEGLDPGLSAYALCAAGHPDRTWVRTVLACLRLRGARADEPVGRLSAGERGKVAMAMLLLSGANVLLLDEPTNHLDAEAREALEGTLAQFPGAIVFVSHDRVFTEALADRVLAW